MGGLGSNIYLYRFLKAKLEGTIEVIQPESGYYLPIFKLKVDRISAVMLGAVLYKLGLDTVKSRIMRRSYGVVYNVEFLPGYHPPSQRYVCLDDVTRCQHVMNWYVRKVCILMRVRL